jgi:hypothetical protein
MGISTEELRAACLRSGNVYAGSKKVGGIGQIYLDDVTSEPTWVTVKTGLFGPRSHLYCCIRHGSRAMTSSLTTTRTPSRRHRALMPTAT